MTDAGLRTVGDVLTDIRGNVERLVKAEIQLVKAGATEWVQSRVAGVTTVAVGAVFGVLALGLLLLGAVALLAETLRPWQAALLVAGVVGLVAVLVIAGGLRSLRKVALPRGMAIRERD